MGAGASTQRLVPHPIDARAALTGKPVIKPPPVAQPPATTTSPAAPQSTAGSTTEQTPAADADSDSDDDEPVVDMDAVDVTLPIVPTIDGFTKEFKYFQTGQRLPGVSVLDMQRAVALSNELQGVSCGRVRSSIDPHGLQL